MSTWSTSNLGDAMLAQAMLDRIQSRFQARYPDTERGGGPAVFVRHESEGRLHCEVIVYFSPDATDLARELDAVPCKQPVAQGLGLLAGAETCWSVYFPVDKA